MDFKVWLGGTSSDRSTAVATAALSSELDSVSSFHIKHFFCVSAFPYSNVKIGSCLIQITSSRTRMAYRKI